MARTHPTHGLLARFASFGQRRRRARFVRNVRAKLREAWTWLVVFGPRAAIRHWWPAWRRRDPVLPALAGAALVAAGVAFLGLGLDGAEPADEGASSAFTSLPVLPVITSEFTGVPLETYLSSPALTGLPRDELLSSTVLRDPEFARAVHWWVGYWTGPAARWFPGFLERMQARGSAVDSALATHDFPPSLRYLPLIESGYDPRVTSRTGAAGMWQLMPSTARGLGLQVSTLVDERRHPERSTTAALEYLGALRGEFDSWFLTLAAYNSGPTRVRSILRRYAPEAPHSDSLFWALRDRFPVETREFVPKLYGAMWVASRPEAYGFGPGAAPGVLLDD